MPMPRVLALSLSLVCFFVVGSLFAEPVRVSVDFPINTAPAKGAFSTPDEFRDVWSVCKDPEQIIKFITEASMSAFQAQGYSVALVRASDKADQVQMKYIMDPVTRDALEKYNSGADPLMRLDPRILYSAEFEVDFRRSASSVASTAIVSPFYYVGKRRKAYDKPFDGKVIYRSLSEEIARKVHAVSCQ